MPVSRLSTTNRIDLVTFDLYDTLVEMDATRWHRFGRAMQAVGFAADDDLLRTIDRAAEDYYTIENGRSPIRERSPEGKAGFWIEYTRIYLEAAGAPADPETVARVRQHFVDEIGNSGWTYSMFDDVMLAVQRLEAAGVKRAVISNADADVTAFCLRMGFAPHMDIIVTSALVGYEKPDQRTFFAALDPLGIGPEHALHVGDQALSDVSGSRAIGMQAALIDRYGRHGDDEHIGAIIVQSLTELVDLVLEHNQSIG
ncbi:MAG: HAD-IA family hydrolase [Thermomicrobiales bacterium]